MSQSFNFPPSADIKTLDTLHPHQELYLSTSVSTASPTLMGVSYFDRLHMLYVGGELLRVNANLFLPKGNRELASISYDRVSKFCYKPILSSLINFYVSKLNSGEIDVRYRADDTVSLPPEQEAFYQSFLYNCDNAGTSLQTFFKQILVDALLMGTAYFLVDLPKVDSAPASLGEQMASGALNPFLIRYDPRQIRNWQEDSYGNLEWILVASKDIVQVPLQEPTVVESWTYFTKDVYATYQAEFAQGKAKPTTAKLVSTGPHAMSASRTVPVQRMSASEHWIGDRVSLQCSEYLILDNSLQYSINYSCIPLPCATSGMVAGVEVPVDLSMMASNYSVISLPYAAKFEFIEVKGTTYEAAAHRLTELLEAVYRAAFMQPQSRSNKATAAVSSGFSKVQDMTATLDVLDALASVVKEAYENALAAVALIRQDENIMPDVRGISFVESLLDEKLDRTVIYESLEIGKASPTLLKQVWKDLNHCQNSDADAGIMAIIDAEIDAYIPPPNIDPPPTITETIRTTE